MSFFPLSLSPGTEKTSFKKKKMMADSDCKSMEQFTDGDLAMDEELSGGLEEPLPLLEDRGSGIAESASAPDKNVEDMLHAVLGLETRQTAIPKAPWLPHKYVPDPKHEIMLLSQFGNDMSWQKFEFSITCQTPPGQRVSLVKTKLYDVRRAYLQFVGIRELRQGAATVDQKATYKWLLGYYSAMNMWRIPPSTNALIMPWFLDSCQGVIQLGFGPRDVVKPQSPQHVWPLYIRPTPEKENYDLLAPDFTAAGLTDFHTWLIGQARSFSIFFSKITS